ncbi:MAG: DUF3096 domain-containing protein [Desulfobacterales bacterium]|nr:DUF3096 domain-containing protein [Desulfobacterales bacterium]
MTFHIEIQGILSVLAGVLILFMPKMLNYIVAAYLIIYGVLGMIQ